MIQPSFEELIQIVRTNVQTNPFDSLRVLLLSRADLDLIEAVDNPDFRAQMQESMRGGLTPVGTLSLQGLGHQIEARRSVFPWHRDDEEMVELFDLVSSEVIDCIREEAALLAQNDWKSGMESGVN